MGRFAVCLGFIATTAACGPREPRVRPDHGPVRGEQRVRIEHVPFPAGSAPVIYFGGRAGKGVVVEGPDVASVVTPASDVAGPVSVEIHASDRVVKLDESFTYEARPSFILEPQSEGGS